MFKIVEIILIIIACITILRSIITFIINIGIVLFDKDQTYVGVTRNVCFYKNAMNECYVIPTFYVYKEFDNKKYPTLCILWLDWIYSIQYHIKTSEEEDIEAEVREEMYKRK